MGERLIQVVERQLPKFWVEKPNTPMLGCELQNLMTDFALEFVMTTILLSLCVCREPPSQLSSIHLSESPFGRTMHTPVCAY